MEASEVRIGNFVKLNDTIPFQIKGIWNKEIFYDGNWVGVNSLEEVHLSPEILEACGFVGDDSKNKYKFMYLTLKNYSDYESWIVTKNEYDINPGMPLLRHLHQLQNFYFAYTGNELMIDEQKLQRSVATTAK